MFNCRDVKFGTYTVQEGSHQFIVSLKRRFEYIGSSESLTHIHEALSCSKVTYNSRLFKIICCHFLFCVLFVCLFVCFSIWILENFSATNLKSNFCQCLNASGTVLNISNYGNCRTLFLGYKASKSFYYSSYAFCWGIVYGYRLFSQIPGQCFTVILTPHLYALVTWNGLWLLASCHPLFESSSDLLLITSWTRN